MRDVVRDSRQHRRHDQSGIDAGCDEFVQRAQPGCRNRRARLELPRELRIVRDQRDVHL